MMFNFSKALYWLGLIHVLLGAAIEHTKHHRTLTEVDDAIEEIGGLAGTLTGQGGAKAPPAMPAEGVSP